MCYGIYCLTSSEQHRKDAKGQLKSEWIYEVINFSNYQLQNLKDFCPESLFEAKLKRSTRNFEYTWQT